MLFAICRFFLTILIKIYFRNTIRSPSSLDQDQAPHFVRPDWVLNYLQRLPAGSQEVGKKLYLSICYMCLSYEVASKNEITPCVKIDKPLVVYRFLGDIMK